jgi:hypothetical protein
MHCSLCKLCISRNAKWTLLALTQANKLDFIPKGFCFVDFIASDPLDRMPKRPFFECTFVLATQMFFLQTQLCNFLFPICQLSKSVESALNNLMHNANNANANNAKICIVHFQDFNANANNAKPKTAQTLEME